MGGEVGGEVGGGNTGGGGGEVGGEVGGGGEAGGEAIVTVGSSSIVMLRAMEAAAAVPRVEASEVCTAVVVVEAGTAMMAVMSTLPAVTATVTATATVTSDLSTPAAVATPCCKLEVSEWSLTLPLAISVRTIVSVEGGGDGGDSGGSDGGEGGGGKGGGDAATASERCLPLSTRNLQSVTTRAGRASASEADAAPTWMWAAISKPLI